MSVLKNNIAESALELADLAREHQKETDESRRGQIRARISELERFVMENKRQLETMG